MMRRREHNGKIWNILVALGALRSDTEIIKIIKTTETGRGTLVIILHDAKLRLLQRQLRIPILKIDVHCVW